MAVTAQDIQQLYIAYFNRPADYHGLPFHVRTGNLAGLAAVAENFERSQEFLSTYAGKTDEQFVGALYQNLFGRDADVPGLSFWVDLLGKGVVTKSSIAINMLKGAINQDAATVANKLTAAEVFYDALDNPTRIAYYDGNDANARAKLWLATVTTKESLLAAIQPAVIDAILDPIVIIGGSGVELSLLGNAVSTSAGLITLDMAQAASVSNVSASEAGASALSVVNAGAGFTLTQSGPASAPVSVRLAVDTGTQDALKLAFRAADGFTSTALTTATGVENLHIALIDTATGIANTAPMAIRVSAPAATSVTVTGAHGADLAGGLQHAGLTHLNALRLTGSGEAGGLRFTSGVLSADAVIQGSVAGDNVIDFSAATKAVSYTGGLGADTVTVGSGANSVTLGGGQDTLYLGRVNQSQTVLTTVTDLGVGDRIDTGVAFSNASGKLGAAIDGAAFNDLQTNLNIGAGRDSGHVWWFQFSGDTYLVQDVSAANIFVAGQDIVVKLSGIVDLSDSTLANGLDVLTIA